MGLVAVWLGSGGDKVKLNFAAQNMQAGQVFAILILYKILNGIAKLRILVRNS